MDDTQAADLGGAGTDVIQRLRDVIDVALRINTPWKGQPYQFQGRRLLAAVRMNLAEHDAADLDRADACRQIKLHTQRLRRVLAGGQVRQQGGRVDIDGMPAGRLHDG